MSGRSLKVIGIERQLAGLALHDDGIKETLRIEDLSLGDADDVAYLSVR